MEGAAPSIPSPPPLPPFPATLTIDYPSRPLDRFSTFFRLLALIPIIIVLVLISQPGFHVFRHHGAHLAGGSSLFLATLLMLLFRQKYPRWWFDWNLAITRFGMRIAVYAALLRDEYPSTDEDQAVHLELEYPDAKRLDRWLPLIKWLLAIPHYICLWFLSILSIGATILAWFAILVTGQYPRSLFEFVVGVFRWWVRVAAYAFLLVTDRYPPFSLSA
jgi:hypothetical protein